MRRRTAVAALAAIVVTVVPYSSPAQAGGSCRGHAATDAKRTTLSMNDVCYLPTVIRVDVGRRLTISNDSSVAHTVSGMGGWGSDEELNPGDTFAVTFRRSGVYPFYCHIHLGMIGTVVVGDGRAAAETIDVATISDGTVNVAGAQVAVPPDPPIADASIAPVTTKVASRSTTRVLVPVGTVAAAVLLGVGFALVRRSRRELRTA